METTHDSKKTMPRDVFLYLLMIFVLATSAVNVGTILFQLINKYLPGDTGYYWTGRAEGVIRWSVSSLVVMFPVLAWAVRFLKRDVAAHPEKRELKIRRWLLYLTLFVTGITVIGDTVALVYNYLNGDLTLRFVLKVGVVALLSGSIFWYWLKELHGRSLKATAVFEKVAIAAVAAVLVAGFAVAGSPAAQRARANDERRSSDLQTLESQIIFHWQAKGRLPANLDDLREGTIGGFVPPVDPLTGQPYEYRVVAERTYELCATFETPTDAGGSPRARPAYPDGSQVWAWDHDEGRACFTGTIDPDRYLPLSPIPKR